MEKYTQQARAASIPDAAIEAAAKGLAGVFYSRWSMVPEVSKPRFLRDARLALEAAAPRILADAWDEGWQKAHSCDDPAMAGIFLNPHRSARG